MSQGNVDERRPALAELLLRGGYLTEARFDELVRGDGRATSRLPELVTAGGVLDESALAELLSSEYALPCISEEEFLTKRPLRGALAESFVLRYRVLPFEDDSGQLCVAMSDPSDYTLRDRIRLLLGPDVKLAVAPALLLQALIERALDVSGSDQELLDQIGHEHLSLIGVGDETQIAVDSAAEDAPVSRLVNAILSKAIQRRASDVHFEPYERTLRVRLRVDGILDELAEIPPRLKNAISARLKIMSSLDIAERRLPQDGRVKLTLASRDVDLRVSVLPTLWGEKVVVRILNRSDQAYGLTQIGLEGAELRSLKNGVTRSDGMILVTGPTGSGKTTTLYAALQDLDLVQLNVSTVEDPVEMNMPGVNQVQTHDEIGRGFARVLRSLLRQDPDVIMVGEIRDVETAAISIKASLTGHLVLTTLHTRDTASAITRLLDMGMEAFLVASSIRLIVAQRLLRRLCTRCREEGVFGDPSKPVGQIPPDRLKVCAICGGSGYAGRLAVYELLEIDDDLRRKIVRGVSAQEIKQIAKARGMRCLRESAMLKFHGGETTLDEVLRVTEE